VAIIAGMGLRMIGVPPGPEEILRLIIFVFYSIVYGAFWLALALLFSLLFKQVTTSALTSLAIWLFVVVFFLFGIAGFIANAIVPIDSNSPVELQAENAGIAVALSRISPVYLYGEASLLLILPKTMTGFGINPGELIYPLPVGQSLLLVWPHLTSLIALTALCFAISYVKFMREEIRST
jgi:ABC-2 type transport system permease protein